MKSGNTGVNGRPKPNPQAHAHPDWQFRGPLYIERILDVVTCGVIKRCFLTQTPKNRSFQGIVDPAKRHCEFVILPDTYDSVFHAFAQRHIPLFFGVSIDSSSHHPAIAYRYPPGIGFIPHCDQVTPIEIERAKTNNQPVMSGDFTLVFFLSDPLSYGGGELYFPEHGIEFKPPAGSLVVFPAVPNFIHGVSEVTYGERDTAVYRVHIAAHKVLA